MRGRIFKEESVIDAARNRISLIFDNFKEITVSLSSGKDSTVLYHLVLQEAKKRNRKFRAFFLDQEAEYENSIKIIRRQMSNPLVIPNWFQVPIDMTNATSMKEYFLHAWGENDTWMRDKDRLAIHEIKESYPQRFYKFFDWYEQKKATSAYLVGLRAEEGIMRYRAVTKYDGWNGLRWSTMTNNVAKFYPIYDFTVYDVWKFMYDYNIEYNKIYDLMFMDGASIYSEMRVSNLIHEKSIKCLESLPKFEPETYNKLCKRISGVATASRYIFEKSVFSNRILPSYYKNWKEYRDFLLSNINSSKHKDKFQARFDRQKKNERIYRMQVKQLLMNDHEGSLTYDTKKEEKAEATRDKWRKIL